MRIFRHFKRKKKRALIKQCLFNAIATDQCERARQNRRTYVPPIIFSCLVHLTRDDGEESSRTCIIFIDRTSSSCHNLGGLEHLYYSRSNQIYTSMSGEKEQDCLFSFLSHEKFTLQRKIVDINLCKDVFFFNVITFEHLLVHRGDNSQLIAPLSRDRILQTIYGRQIFDANKSSLSLNLI